MQKYIACNIQFLCSRKWSKVSDQTSEWSKGRDKHCAEFLTPLSQRPCRRILISCLVCFLRPVKLRGSKKISLLFLHLFITLERTGKTKNADILPKFELKRLKIRCTRTYNVCPISWIYSFQKKSKTVSETFFRLNEIKTTRRENSYLRFTNKRLNLPHNNSAQMLTRQDVKYCSAREFDSTFQFYQASLLVAHSEGKLLL